ncbi:Endo-1,3(4)-beta-glucanase [Phytophthora cactorum]|nr:Endo-1,3(4)-beta-glucanase [Phytophthora cactorum]
MREDVVCREPIINVVDELLAQPIPTNKGRSNSSTPPQKTLTPLLKEALFGIQTWYSYTYCRLADKPGYELYSFIDMGVAVQTCMSGSITSCMDSALVHGMVFMSATSTGLTTSIQLDYATTLPDGSTPGKVVVQFANGLIRLNWHPSSADSHSENSDQGVYDDYASYVVRGGDMLVQSRRMYVMGGASTTQSRGAIVLHSSARGEMAPMKDRADDEVNFYPTSKHLQTDGALDTGSWYYNAYQKYALLCLMEADISLLGALIEPFISNSLSEPLIYETTYKGIVTSQVFTTDDVKVEFGNGVYNDHHYHYGYWITALIILKKLGPMWTGMAQVETMVVTLLRDVANPHKSRRSTISLVLRPFVLIRREQKPQVHEMLILNGIGAH